MEIVNYPHPVLRWKSSEITEISADLKQVIGEMFELMYASKGIGLAANQVGLPYRFFVMNPSGEPGEKSDEFVLINPVIVKRRGTHEGEEGCLSLPGMYADVVRAEKITVEAYDLEGKLYALELEGLPARVVQHEGDHLDGVLFIDRVLESDLKRLDAGIKDLEWVYRKQQAEGKLASDEELKKQLKKMVEKRQMQMA